MGAWLSGRESAELLGEVGVGREPARRLLHAGFAGSPVRTRGALLYDEERVRALCRWPRAHRGDLVRVIPGGLSVARMRQEFSVALPWQDLAAIAGRPRQMSPWARLQVVHRARQLGGLPFVVTVSGFVAFGADIVGVELVGDGLVGDEPAGDGSAGEAFAGPWGTRLVLDRPGRWFELLREHRLRTGPGAEWLLWQWQWAHDRLAAAGEIQQITEITGVTRATQVTQVRQVGQVRRGPER